MWVCVERWGRPQRGLIKGGNSVLLLLLTTQKKRQIYMYALGVGIGGELFSKERGKRVCYVHLPSLQLRNTQMVGWGGKRREGVGRCTQIYQPFLHTFYSPTTILLLFYLRDH